MRSAWSKRHGGALKVLCQASWHAIIVLTMLCIAQKAVVRACRNAIEFNSIPSVERLVPGGRNGLKLKIKIGTPFPVRAHTFACRGTQRLLSRTYMVACMPMSGYYTNICQYAGHR